MPQLPLLTTDKPMYSITIEIKDETLSLQDATTVHVKVALVGEEPRTIAHASLQGVMTDYLSTYVQDVVQAWAYEGAPSDVARAAARALSLARRHRRAHERRGSD